MSKMIKLPQDILDQYTKEFYETLRSGKFPDGKVNFSKTLGTVDRKATVLFTELAWQKMQILIREFNDEVAWHGIATRCEEKDTYLISDILVYPQEVTGTTVTTDQEKYQMWLMEQEDDVFNNIRMQGHSHVNMATSPSSVDLNLYESILDQLSGDMFYIFMIWNKSGSKTVKIYDLRENILFETSDVTVSIKDVGDMSGFLKEAKELVQRKTYTSTYGGNGYPHSGYGGYGGYGAKKKDEKKDVTSLGKHKPLTSENKKSKGRKGKRKKGNKSTKQVTLDDYFGLSTQDVDGYDDVDLGGLSEYEDEYWRRKYGFDC